jgi:hypothetical protein
MAPSTAATAKDIATVLAAPSSSTAMTIPHPSPPTGPTLLPASVASMISLFSKSTSISIRLGTKVGSTLLNTARTGTMTSLELSRAAVEGIVRRGSQGVLTRRGHEKEVETWATKGVRPPLCKCISPPPPSPPC